MAIYNAKLIESFLFDRLPIWRSATIGLFEGPIPSGEHIKFVFESRTAVINKLHNINSELLAEYTYSLLNAPAGASTTLRGHATVPLMLAASTKRHHPILDGTPNWFMIGFYLSSDDQRFTETGLIPELVLFGALDTDADLTIDEVTEYIELHFSDLVMNFNWIT